MEPSVLIIIAIASRLERGSRSANMSLRSGQQVFSLLARQICRMRLQNELASFASLDRSPSSSSPLQESATNVQVPSSAGCIDAPNIRHTLQMAPPLT